MASLGRPPAALARRRISRKATPRWSPRQRRGHGSKCFFVRRSLGRSLRNAIDHRTIRRYEPLSRRGTHFGRRHLVEIAQNRVDAIRVVVVERERREQIGAPESRNDAAFEALEE